MRSTILATTLAAVLAANGSAAQTRQYLQHPQPYSAPASVPLAPVLDPNYKENQPYTVETVTVQKAPAAGWQLSQVLQDQPLAASFREAVMHNGLDHAIDADRGFTVFVPVTTGRNSSDPVRVTPLDNFTKEELSRYITNNRVNIELLKGTVDRYPAIDGSIIRISKLGDAVSVNGARVTDSVKTPQGFIYYIKTPFTTAPKSGILSNQ